MNPTSPVSDSLLDQVHDLTLACAAGEATPEQIVLLDSLVCSDDRACQIYVRAMLDGSALRRWAVTLSHEASADTVELSDDELMPVVGVPVAGCGFTFFGTPVSAAMAYSPQNILFSYLVAAVLVGCGLLVGSLIPVSQTLQIARDSEVPATCATVVAACVGHITGMVDCVFKNDECRMINDVLRTADNGIHHSSFSTQHSAVSLGDRFALRSGLLEITYDAGAKVILQGPVKYEVDSAVGGRLTVGRLTAKLEKKSGEQGTSVPCLPRKQETSASRSFYHATSARSQQGTNVPRSPDLSTLPSALFTITTPTAVVTDLGTEFGIDVDERGITETHVFSGVVKVVGRGRIGGVPQRVLLAGDTARLISDAKVVEVLRSAPRQFVRVLPRIETTQEPELIAQVDYSDSWTMNSPTRAGSYLLLEDPIALCVEQCYGNPPRSWSFSHPSAVTTWPFDGSPVPWPGTKVRGSKSGFTETGLTPESYLGFQYGLRDDFVVQFDGVQTTDRMNLTIGERPTTIFGNEVLSVFIRPVGTKYPEIGIHTAACGEADTGLKSGIASAWQWHNYAVRFNLRQKKLAVWVDRQLRGEIDLAKIVRKTDGKKDADWASLPLSNRFVTIGGFDNVPNTRIWTDNFRVGSPRETAMQTENGVEGKANAGHD